MSWTKLGRIFEPPSGSSWAASHAALPAVDAAGAALRHVYFSPRDVQGRACIGRFELDLGGPSPRVASTGPAPLLEPGEPGAFDESGVTMSCVVAEGPRRHLYYTGWSLGVTVPFYLFAGLAVSEDGGATWTRASKGPLLDRSDADPYLTASPWVLVENGVWRMWYVSGSRWDRVEGRPRHYYNIRYAESRDGVRWQRRAEPCIDYASSEEHAFSRPCVLKDGASYRMWYAYRGTSYRIGYAESDDGIVWRRRDDQAGIDVSSSGWDSEMLAYPCVFDHGGTRWMLYNGNDYGRTGIGLARHDAPPSAPRE